jgi:antitoxin FitA
MAVHLQIRDLPNELHQTLRQRATTRGLSLRQYALEVLQEHCRQPTLDEWLDGLSRLTPVALSISAAEAVRQAREAEDAEMTDALSRT